MNENSPYAKFNCGNKESLKDFPNKNNIDVK
jgi:secreted Zn-dependent insulinase-like peptidase